MLKTLSLLRHRLVKWLVGLHTTCVVLHVLIVLSEAGHKALTVSGLA